MTRSGSINHGDDADLEARLSRTSGRAGTVFLLEAAAAGYAALYGHVDARRAGAAFAILVLAGWAAGVTLGHLGKLLSLSAWSTWPPGPRPKQAALYPRRPWEAEAAASGGSGAPAA